MNKKLQPAIIFIFITLLVDVMSIGIIIPILPKLLLTFCDNNYTVASQHFGFLSASYAVMQFIFAPIIGGLSDKYGRRPVLLLSMLGFGLDYMMLYFAPNLVWLYVGRMLAGITGASFTTATAYIADVSTPEKRAQNFGMIGAAFGLGFIIGPALGGLIGHWGIKMPFLFSAGITMLNFLYGLLILPESLKPENRREFDWKRANPVGLLMQLRKYPVVFGLIGALLFMNIAGQAHPSTWSLFTMKRFGWDSDHVGYSLAFVGLMIALVQGVLIRVIVPTLGERRAILLGLLLFSIGFFLFSIATESWMMYAFMIPFSLSGIAGPTLQGVLSKQVPLDAQGELQGGLTSLMSITTIIGPLLATQLFSYFTKEDAIVYFPGAAFLASSLLALIALGICWVRLVPKRGI